MSKKAVITGGGGFIGAYLVKKLVHEGWNISVIDNMVRGDTSRFALVSDYVQLHNIDVRDETAVTHAVAGSEVVFHLAAINGTENFYKHPELVLDVGIRGALAVVNACRRAGVPDLVVASSAEVYQTPEIIPTPEDVALTLPDSLNPRYSYGGSKIISELIAFNYGKDHFRKIQVFRPHNVYGPDMGWKHVIPELILRLNKLTSEAEGTISLPIQGDGTETRAFAYVDDVVDGILTMYEFGAHREIYHIGNDEEVSINTIIENLSKIMDCKVKALPSPATSGGTARRCPDISKLCTLGYRPQVPLVEGLKKTCEWYLANSEREFENELA